MASHVPPFRPWPATVWANWRIRPPCADRGRLFRPECPSFFPRIVSFRAGTGNPRSHRAGRSNGTHPTKLADDKPWWLTQSGLVLMVAARQQSSNSGKPPGHGTGAAGEGRSLCGTPFASHEGRFLATRFCPARRALQCTSVRKLAGGPRSRRSLLPLLTETLLKHIRLRVPGGHAT